MNASGFSSSSSTSMAILPADFKSIELPHQPDVHGIVALSLQVEDLLGGIGVFFGGFGRPGVANLIGQGSGFEEFAQNGFPDSDNFATCSLSFVSCAEGEGKGDGLAPVVHVFHGVQGCGE
jgi:hypothetical protein